MLFNLQLIMDNNVTKIRMYVFVNFIQKTREKKNIYIYGLLFTFFKCNFVLYNYI